MQNGKIDTI